jgi:hypothetical protein
VRKQASASELLKHSFVRIWAIHEVNDLPGGLSPVSHAFARNKLTPSLRPVKTENVTDLFLAICWSSIGGPFTMEKFANAPEARLQA